MEMLSLMYMLYQPCSIFEAIQHINMDKVFKENYKMFVFDRLPLIKPVYQRQVQDLSQLWSKVDDLIDREELFLAFASQCNRLEIPFIEYDLDSAFEKAQTEWAENIITTADFILMWYEEDITTQVAFWDNGHNQVDTHVCKLYRDWLMNSYLSELDRCM